MTLFKRLCSVNNTALQSILTHPFNQDLSNGILSKKVYDFFVEQDTLYLGWFAKALQQIAEKAENPDHTQQFAQLSTETVAFEQSMLASSGSRFFSPITETPVLKQYTNHLLQTTKQAHITVAIAAVLPCFWIYCELGQQISHPIPDIHPYRDWLATYTDPAYIASTNQLIHTFNALSNDIEDPLLLAEIHAAFSKSVAFEEAFFETCYVRHCALDTLAKKN